MRKQDNEVIEEGEREAKWDAMTDILSDSFKDVMEAYERDPHEEEGLTEKMIKVVTAPYAEQKRREEESKAISEAIKKAEEKHSKGEQLIINPTDATPLQKAALMTAMQCRENLSPDIEVQGPEAILNAVNACFDRVTYENRCKATTQVLRVLGHRGPQRCD